MSINKESLLRFHEESICPNCGNDVFDYITDDNIDNEVFTTATCCNSDCNVTITIRQNIDMLECKNKEGEIVRLTLLTDYVDPSSTMKFDKETLKRLDKIEEIDTQIKELKELLNKILLK